MDEEKFFFNTISIFSCPGLENKWLIWNESGKPSGWEPNTKNVHVKDFLLLLDNQATKKLARALAKESDAIIFHYFDAKYLPIFFELKTLGAKVIIQLWGGDYTRHYLPPSKIIGRATFQFCIHPFTKTAPLPVTLARLYYDLKWHMDRDKYSYRKALESADHVGCELGSFELQHFRIRAYQVNGLHVPYSANVEKMLEIPPTKLTGQNVLLGNSAALTNSHIDTLLILNVAKQNFDSCIIPLSYAGNPQSTEAIKSLALELFGQKTQILDSFMERAEYFHLLESTKYVIMNHTRQQALGNILWALANCRTLYLNEDGVIFKKLQSLNFHVHTLSSISKQGLQAFSQKKLNQNRENLEVFYPSSVNFRHNLANVLH